LAGRNLNFFIGDAEEEQEANRLAGCRLLPRPLLVDEARTGARSTARSICWPPTRSSGQDWWWKNPPHSRPWRSCWAMAVVAGVLAGGPAVELRVHVGGLLAAVLGETLLAVLFGALAVDAATRSWVLAFGAGAAVAAACLADAPRLDVGRAATPAASIPALLGHRQHPADPRPRTWSAGCRRRHRSPAGIGRRAACSPRPGQLTHEEASTRIAQQRLLHAVQRPDAYAAHVLESAGALIVLSVWPGRPEQPAVLFLSRVAHSAERALPRRRNPPRWGGRGGGHTAQVGSPRHRRRSHKGRRSPQDAFACFGR